MCRAAKKKSEECLEDFHFHIAPSHLKQSAFRRRKRCAGTPRTLRCQYHMNIYAHSTREAKRTSARLLDKVVGGNKKLPLFRLVTGKQGQTDKGLNENRREALKQQFGFED